MPNKRTHDVVVTTGEYTNGQGEKKKRYTNVGSAFTDDQGRISIKLDCVPVTPEWSGWLSLYEPKQQGRDRTPADSYRQGSQSAPQARTPARSSNAGADYPDDSDDNPFNRVINLTHF